MKLLFFLLNNRYYRSSIFLVCAICAILLASNVLLCLLLLHKNEKIIFVPTHSHDPFILHGHYNSTYLEKLSMFLSQQLLSWDTLPQPNDCVDRFVAPTAQPQVQKQLQQLSESHKKQGITCVFSPKHTHAVSVNSTHVKGSLAFYINKQLVASHNATIIMEFTLHNATCLLHAISWTIDSPDN